MELGGNQVKTPDTLVSQDSGQAGECRGSQRMAGTPGKAHGLTVAPWHNEHQCCWRKPAIKMSWPVVCVFLQWGGRHGSAVIPLS